MLLFALETRALWDLVAGLRLLVGVLLSGVPLPLSFSLSILSLSLAPEGGIASNICSMLEKPGAQIEADLVFRRSEISDIFASLRSPILLLLHYSPTISDFSIEKEDNRIPEVRLRVNFLEFLLFCPCAHRKTTIYPRVYFLSLKTRFWLELRAFCSYQFPGFVISSEIFSLQRVALDSLCTFALWNDQDSRKTRPGQSFQVPEERYFTKTTGWLRTRRVWLFSK